MSLGNLYKAIEQIESGGDPDALSSKGARGLMQVMPSTARKPGYGIRPAKNDSKEEYVRVGKDYAKAMYKKFDGDIEAVLAAYNMGPGATEKWIASGRDKSKLPRETKNYIPKVKSELNKLENQRGSSKMVKKRRGLEGGSQKERLNKALGPTDKKGREEFLKLDPKIRSKLRKDRYDKLTPSQKNQLEGFKTAAEAAMWIGSLTPIGRGLKVGAAGVKALKGLSNAAKTVKKKVMKVTAPKDAKSVGPVQKVTRKTLGLTEKGRRTGDAIRDKAGKVTGLTEKQINLAKNIRRAVPVVAGTAVATSLLGDKKGPKKGEAKVTAKPKLKNNRAEFAAAVKKMPKPKSTVTAAEQKAANSFPDGLGSSIDDGLSKFIKQRSYGNFDKGLATFNPGMMEKGLAALGGGKERDALTSAEDSYFTELLGKRDDVNGLSDSEKDYIKNFRKKKGGKVIAKKKGSKVIAKKKGSKVMPKKKGGTVYRRGGGKALRGFGKATYSNKPY